MSLPVLLMAPAPANAPKFQAPTGLPLASCPRASRVRIASSRAMRKGVSLAIFTCANVASSVVQ